VSPTNPPPSSTPPGRKPYLSFRNFAGPGSYRAEGSYSSDSSATTFQTADACNVDVAADGRRGLTGTYRCELRSSSATSVVIEGSFGCPIGALDGPIFSHWAH
jgi:hypothetical protein